jgi:uncharacterized membrane protein
MRDLIMFVVVLVYMVYGAPIASEFVGSATAYAAAMALLIVWGVTHVMSAFRADR